MAKKPSGQIIEESALQMEDDAEFILETIMKRQRFSPNTRDELAAALSKVAAGIPLRRKKPRAERAA